MPRFRGDTMIHTNAFDEYIERFDFKHPDLDAAIRMHELLELARRSLLARFEKEPSPADAIALCGLMLADIHHRQAHAGALPE